MASGDLSVFAKGGTSGPCNDVAGMVEGALRESYLMQVEDMRDYANRVKWFNFMKKELRELIQEHRDLLVKWTADRGGNSDPNDWDGCGQDGQPRSGNVPRDFNPGSVPETNPDGSFKEPNEPWIPPGGTRTENGQTFPVHTREQIENHVKKLEDQLTSLGDDAQLANVDLQNGLQKMQQTLQMMSNISKMLSDTALGIIRKFGG